MFFADLTPYEYGGFEPRDNVVNVGWLSREHLFATGEVPDAFLIALRRLVTSPVNLYRGHHICEFCPDPAWRMSPGGGRMRDVPPETMGNGEIRVRGHNGLVYVAPVLVAHYVEAHKYLPPAEFIEAVVSTNVRVFEKHGGEARIIEETSRSRIPTPSISARGTSAATESGILLLVLSAWGAGVALLTGGNVYFWGGATMLAALLLYRGWRQRGK